MGQTTTVRERQITRTSIIGILTNVVLAAFKAAVGLVAHSIAIVLDAVNNLSDALSSVITIVGIRLAKRKPDKDHPFGHGRIEYFSAIIIAGIVFAAGVTSLVESVKKLFQPGVPDYSTVTLIVISVAILTKLVLGRYVKKKGRRTAFRCVGSQWLRCFVRCPYLRFNALRCSGDIAVAYLSGWHHRHSHCRVHHQGRCRDAWPSFERSVGPSCR